MGSGVLSKQKETCQSTSSLTTSYKDDLTFCSIWAIVSELDLSEWMSSLPVAAVTRPIIYLAIPGTHNSMTYTIKKYAMTSPDVDFLANKSIPLCIRPWLRRWCKTQSLDVTDQLSHGIRYFDLRLCRRKATPRIFYCHGMFGGEVIPELVKINSFLDNHKNEVVILDFQHFYEFLPADHNELIKSIRQIFGTKICLTPKCIQSVNLEFMRKELFQVIIIYRKSLHYDILWPSSLWNTYWPETMLPQEMIALCDDKVKNRNKHCGLISQCVLTATMKTILSPTGSIITSCANKAFQPTLDWIKECTDLKLPINVVIADFIEKEDNHFAKLLIAYNYL